jgi:N6-adenosine-specific RNA methylase IME4
VTNSLHDLVGRDFRCVVADPPWGYEQRGSPWYSGSEPSYDLMKMEDICALPVRDISAPDAHLYLWAVLPMMREAYEVVEAWGFVADTLLTWCKPGPGLGGGWRGNTEHVIVARRGESYMNPTCTKCGLRARGKTRKCSCATPVFHVRGQIVAQKQAFVSCAKGTWYEAPRRAHSEKPELFQDMIEQMSPGPRIELFARRLRSGWTVWGNEVGANIGLGGLCKVAAKKNA